MCVCIFYVRELYIYIYHIQLQDNFLFLSRKNINTFFRNIILLISNNRSKEYCRDIHYTWHN